MNQPIFFQPIFQERIWGGDHLTKFGYNIPSNQTGECWAFAAHENGQSKVKTGPFEGKTLGELWETQRELFGHVAGEKFPLLTKILDANDDLSVQVHPNDEYAYKNENGEFGKTECWYIIDCEPEAEIIYGHHAKSREEFVQLIEDGKWDELLTRKQVKKGDFFFVPSGTIHAIGKGILILETQQNSDTTYRVYDYDRTDSNGNKRELHIEKSIEVTTIPAINPSLHFEQSKVDDIQITTFVRDPYFTVHKWEINGQASLEQTQSFQLVSVIEGQGTISVNHEEFEFNKGDHFMLPNEMGKFSLTGNADLIVSHL